MNQYNLNVKDLTLLANYLEKLPIHYSHFNMVRFNSAFGTIPAEIEEHSCGTSGCAVGHAPFVEGIPKPEKEELWSDYSVRIAFLNDGFLCEDQESLWDFMFGPIWFEYDNTPHGAAKRIKLALSNPDACLEVMKIRYRGDSITESYNNLLLELEK
jgi:hypothetical protein